MQIHITPRHVRLTTAIHAHAAGLVAQLEDFTEIFGAHLVLIHDEAAKPADRFSVKAHVAVRGPDVHAELVESCAFLEWPTATTPGAARLELPPGLRWTMHRGETDPILGWYSCGLGQRIPAFALIGCGRSAQGIPLITRLEFSDITKVEPAVVRSAVSRHV